MSHLAEAAGDKRIDKDVFDEVSKRFQKLKTVSRGIIDYDKTMQEDIALYQLGLEELMFHSDEVEAHVAEVTRAYKGYKELYEDREAIRIAQRARIEKLEKDVRHERRLKTNAQRERKRGVEAMDTPESKRPKLQHLPSGRVLPSTVRDSIETEGGPPGSSNKALHS